MKVISMVIHIIHTNSTFYPLFPQRKLSKKGTKNAQKNDFKNDYFDFNYLLDDNGI